MSDPTNGVTSLGFPLRVQSKQIDRFARSRLLAGGNHGREAGRNTQSRGPCIAGSRCKRADRSYVRALHDFQGADCDTPLCFKGSFLFEPLAILDPFGGWLFLACFEQRFITQGICTGAYEVVLCFLPGLSLRSTPR